MFDDHPELVIKIIAQANLPHCFRRLGVYTTVLPCLCALSTDMRFGRMRGWFMAGAQGCMMSASDVLDGMYHA